MTQSPKDATPHPRADGATPEIMRADGATSAIMRADGATSAIMRADGAPWRNFYGRRHGKTLRPRQRRLMRDLLPQIAVQGVGVDENPDRAVIDPKSIFAPVRDIWLEIGFGGGEHLLAMARARPQIGFIGCEAFENGVAMALSKFDDAPLDNLRIHYGDVRFLLDVLPDAALGRVYLLYPDPWPKRAHIPRRFFNPWNLDVLARVLRPGAELRLATDIPAYVDHAVRVAAAHPAFETLGQAGDWRAPFAQWPGTRYERKALKAGRRPAYLRFLRKAGTNMQPPVDASHLAR